MTERTDCSLTNDSDLEWRTQGDASQTMFFWADRLIELDNKIEEIKLELKRLENTYTSSEATLFELMARDQVDQFKRNGYSFTPVVKAKASIRSEVKELAYNWLRNSEHADIVKETVHAQTLNALVREWNENGISEDVEQFYSYLNNFDVQSISKKRG